MARFILLSFLVLALACGDDDGPVTDDPTEDASVTDAGGGDDDGGTSDADGGSADDDGGPGPVDAATPTDAGPPPDLGPSPCEGQTIGAPCRERCPGAYECVEGACLPNAMRAGCGGFAGAMCTTRAFPHCATYVGSDYGPCLSEEEFACACSALPDIFECATTE